MANLNGGYILTDPAQLNEDRHSVAVLSYLGEPQEQGLNLRVPRDHGTKDCALLLVLEAHAAGHTDAVPANLDL